jgi:predicted acetyltransferase
LELDSNFVLRISSLPAAVAIKSTLGQNAPVTPPHLHWVGEPDLDRVAECRLRCYAPAQRQLEEFKAKLRADTRAGPGDYLLAERDGRSIGTATHLAFYLWVRGGRVPCQGVAWVGAIKTERRKGGDGPGGATAVMREVVRHARDRGDACSVLMPFRASFYEHFGYGVVERRHEWTVPVAALPSGDFDGVRFFEPDDFDARGRLLRRVNQAGQCDLERTDDQWRAADAAAADGLQVIDRTEGGDAAGSMVLMHEHAAGKDTLRVTENLYDGPAALRRQLHFLSSLRDQYAAVQLTLPVDVPLNRLLREVQLPHRPVNHAVAECKPYTRMQLRVLDHAPFLQAMRWPAEARGSAVVAVHECEGHESRFAVDVSDGRATVTPSTASATFTCPDRTWAAVASGDLSAGDAVRWGLADGAPGVLAALAQGPAPFCHERF